MSEASIFSRMADCKAVVSFIKQIERHPCLYDQNSRDYSNRDLKKRTWMKIAKVYNCSVDDAKTKWTKIRIAYMRTLRLSYQKSGNGTHKKRYYLAKYLKFIKPTKLRKISDNSQSNGFTSSENDDTVEQDEEINNIQGNEKDESLTDYESEGQLDEQELNSQDEIYLDQDLMNDDDFDCKEEIIYDNDSAIDSKKVISNEINKMPKVEKQRNKNKRRNSENQNNGGSHYSVDNHQKSGNQLNSENHRNSRDVQRNPCCDSLECNPRKMFLFSLMPDILKLSENQMRSFRRQVIQILDNVMKE